MKKMFFLLTCIVALQSAYCQISYGGGVVIEYNDFDFAPRIRVSYGIGKSHQIDAEAQYYISSKFWMFNVNYQRKLIRFGDDHQLRLVGGINLFQAPGFRIQGVKYRGATLYGINLGLEYDFNLFRREFFLQPKYIAGFGYRDIELALGIMLGR
jgi:hypothetical protein